MMHAYWMLAAQTHGVSKPQTPRTSLPQHPVYAALLVMQEGVVVRRHIPTPVYSTRTVASNSQKGSSAARMLTRPRRSRRLGASQLERCHSSKAACACSRLTWKGTTRGGMLPQRYAAHMHAGLCHSMHAYMHYPMHHPGA